MSRHTQRLLALSALMAVALLAGGCGQKGPLFLPQDKLEEIERERQQREEPAQKEPAQKKSSEATPLPGSHTSV